MERSPLVTSTATADRQDCVLLCTKAGQQNHRVLSTRRPTYEMAAILVDKGHGLIDVRMPSHSAAPHPSTTSFIGISFKTSRDFVFYILAYFVSS